MVRHKSNPKGSTSYGRPPRHTHTATITRNYSVWLVAKFNTFRKQQKRLDNTRTPTLCTRHGRFRFVVVRPASVGRWFDSTIDDCHAYWRTSAEKWYLLAGVRPGPGATRTPHPSESDDCSAQGDTRWAATTTTTNSSNLLPSCNDQISVENANRVVVVGKYTQPRGRPISKARCCSEHMNEQRGSGTATTVGPSRETCYDIIIFEKAPHRMVHETCNRRENGLYGFCNMQAIKFCPQSQKKTRLIYTLHWDCASKSNSCRCHSISRYQSTVTILISVCAGNISWLRKKNAFHVSTKYRCEHSKQYTEKRFSITIEAWWTSIPWKSQSRGYTAQSNEFRWDPRTEWFTSRWRNVYQSLNNSTSMTVVTRFILARAHTHTRRVRGLDNFPSERRCFSEAQRHLCSAAQLNTLMHSAWCGEPKQSNGWTGKATLKWKIKD